MENKCSSSEGCSGTDQKNSNEHCGCDTKKPECCCPIDKAIEMWACAGHRAWKEVHVDLLKAKILKAWGPQMDKTADAVIEAMGIEWQAMMAQGKAKADLKQKIGSIFCENKR